MQKLFTIITILILGFASVTALSIPALAQTQVPAAGECTGAPGEDLVKCYVPLSPPGSIPGLDEIKNDSDSFQGYIMFAYTILISVGIVLAIILTVYHGFQYSISDIFTKKINAKEALTNIAIGLGLILGAYLILFTINPSIINISFNASLNQAQTNPPKPNSCAVLGEQYGTNITPTKKGVYIDYSVQCYNTVSKQWEFRSLYEPYTGGDEDHCKAFLIEYLAGPNKPAYIHSAKCFTKISTTWGANFQLSLTRATVKFIVTGVFYTRDAAGSATEPGCNFDLIEDRSGVYTNDTGDGKAYKNLREKADEEIEVQGNVANVDAVDIRVDAIDATCSELSDTLDLDFKVVRQDISQPNDGLGF